MDPGELVSAGRDAVGKGLRRISTAVRGMRQSTWGWREGWKEKVEITVRNYWGRGCRS